MVLNKDLIGLDFVVRIYIYFEEEKPSVMPPLTLANPEHKHKLELSENLFVT